MSAIQVDRGPVRPFFTTKTLAEYLDISQRTVRQLLADGSLPSYKIAGLRRIDPADVDRYLARHRARKA